MRIDLSADQRVEVEALVDSGRFATVQEAVEEAVRLLLSQETLRREIRIGVDQADAGELLEHDTVFAQLRSIASDRAEPGR